MRIERYLCYSCVAALRSDCTALFKLTLTIVRKVSIGLISYNFRVLLFVMGRRKRVVVHKRRLLKIIVRKAAKRLQWLNRSCKTPTPLTFPCFELTKDGQLLAEMLKWLNRFELNLALLENVIGEKFPDSFSIKARFFCQAHPVFAFSTCTCRRFQ